MKFRILIHKRAYGFLKDLKSEEKQRIVIKLKQLEDSQGFDLTLLRLQAKRTPTYYELAITKRYSKFMSENSLAKFKARATRHDFTGGGRLCQIWLQAPVGIVHIFCQRYTPYGTEKLYRTPCLNHTFEISSKTFGFKFRLN